MSAIWRPFSIGVIVSVQDEVAANQRLLKYGIKGRSTWYIAHCPL